ncbi:Hypothetical protein Minf_2142 [Methylacidiphilum infernorum V4]|uniref:Uncharacterized protein n=1 Tax=Methylacidiphilum infernorum (isolate V4) TaxID=481448 RepID=B3DZA4_METI4|nr:Hypothetical protein Minf_2142 [Methylacidiphilum infernorum V4]
MLEKKANNSLNGFLFFISSSPWLGEKIIGKKRLVGRGFPGRRLRSRNERHKKQDKHRWGKRPENQGYRDPSCREAELEKERFALIHPYRLK